MKIFEILDLKDIKSDKKKRIVALGFFDGIHLAHQKIINFVVQNAKSKQGIAILITFDINPKEYFTKKKIELVTPLEEKKLLLKKMGIDELYILKFNEMLRNMTKEKFIDDILLKLGVTEVYCGYDYLFGYKAQGTPDFIKYYSNNLIEVNKINKLVINNEKISTTKLKETIYNGNFEYYKKLTNREYKIAGKVIKGKQIGRTINFPTINLELNENYVLPNKLGVYLTKIKYENNYYFSITNIGKNPTINNSNKIKIETHILNFNKEIYNENIEIYFLKHIRNEKKFNNLLELKDQLFKDKEYAQNYFLKNS